ncbi:MAG: hypothetical protein ACRENP_07715 [Longimicrobiales bacterium]
MRVMRIIVLVGLTAASPAAWAGAQSSAAPRPGAGGLSVEQIRADIAAFRTGFMARDNSYSPAARAQAEARLVRLEAAAAQLTPVAFDIAIAQIVALADNGHTGAFAAQRGFRHNRVPIRVTPFADGFRVLRAKTATADLLGAKLIAIDGRRIEQVRDSARTLAGGTAARRDRSANFLMESPAQLHALGLASSAESALFTFELINGVRVERRLTAEPAGADASRLNADRWFFTELLPEPSREWQALAIAGAAPWWLQEPSVPFRWRAAPELDGVVIQLRRTFNAPGQSITEFFALMTQRLTADRSRNLVLDMRLNGGGNLNTARDFVKSLPGLVTGRIFVLTDPWTFSAAISSIGYLEQTAPERVTIVGEEVGDRLEFWAEGGPFTLPNSGIQISISTERHDYQNGCRAFTDCHGPVMRNPIAVPTLAPDIKVPLTIEAYRAGRDPALAAVATALGRR